MAPKGLVADRDPVSEQNVPGLVSAGGGPEGICNVGLIDGQLLDVIQGPGDSPRMIRMGVKGWTTVLHDELALFAFHGDESLPLVIQSGGGMGWPSPDAAIKLQKPCAQALRDTLGNHGAPIVRCLARASTPPALQSLGPHLMENVMANGMHLRPPRPTSACWLERIPCPMPLTSTTTLAEIVSSNPLLTQELERLGLDYCCGGKRNLEEACRQQGLDAQSVIAELASQPIAAEPAPVWMALSPAALVDHLEATHHRYLKAELPRLSELAAKVSRVHGEKHPELIRVAEVLAELRADLEPHLHKEEDVLFPMIRSMGSAGVRPDVPFRSIGTPIAVMEAEHTAVGRLLEQLRKLTGGYRAPADTCASTLSLMAGLAELEADTHLHVHKENNHLFPAAIESEQRFAASR
jgi:regulator of cell morphogenesis and NO signaling